KPISNNENIYILACKSSDMAVVTATDKVYLASWLDEMDDSLDKQGYMYVLDKGDALVTATNEGSVNRAWDLLGADGKRTKVGSLPFSSPTPARHPPHRTPTQVIATPVSTHPGHTDLPS